jgi:transposase
LIRVLSNDDDKVVVAVMLALDPGVVEATWAAVEPLLPIRAPDTHPLGCHRRRIPDRDCFEGILVRLVTGCSWDVAGRLGKGSETTLRPPSRRVGRRRCVRGVGERGVGRL